MTKCEECGLPVDACSALAMYRKSLKYARLGRHAQAAEIAEGADECFDRFNKERKQ